MTTTEQLQKTKFLNGVYNPAEGRDIISFLIERQINFHKLQYLARWEADHSTSTDFRDKKIEVLREQKNELKAMIELAKMEGHNLSIDGTIQVKLVEKGINSSI